MPTKEPKTSARTPLTRDRITAVAMELADGDGISGLSMRKVAAQLDVEAMSLYHHVANKDDLLDAMVDAVFAEIDLPEADEAWLPAMRRRAQSARTVLNHHRWAIGLLDTRTSPGPGTLTHHNAVIGSLREGGFSVADAARAFSLLDSYLYGFVLQEQGLPFDDEDDLSELAASIMAHLPVDRYPYFVEMVTEHALVPGYDYADEFDAGLELLLGSLEREGRRTPDEVAHTAGGLPWTHS